MVMMKFDKRHFSGKSGLFIFSFGVLTGSLFGTVFFTTDSLLVHQRSSKEPSTRQVLEKRTFGEAVDVDIGWKSIHVFYGDQNHMENTHKRGAQSNQDVVVRKLLGGKEKGFFVDLAANDAVWLSNTRLLERDHNWTGICVEPNPIYWRALSYRKCDVYAAVVGKTKWEEVSFALDGVYGGIQKEGFDNDEKKTKKVQASRFFTMPLFDLFHKANVPSIIDYFSLDVEGAELYIMSSFPFDHYSFRIMTIERPDIDLRNLLYKKGYNLVCLLSDFGETLWVSSKDTEVDRDAIKDHCYRGELTEEAKQKGLQMYA